MKQITNEAKAKLIKELNQRKDEFFEELKNVYYVYADDYSEINIFGEKGFDDVCVYSESSELDLTDEEWDQIELEYIKNDNLVEVWNGEVQCVMDVRIINGDIRIIDTEVHRFFGFDKSEFYDEVTSVEKGGDYLWFETKFGFTFKSWYSYYQFYGNEEKINETINTLRNEQQKMIVASEGEGFVYAFNKKNDNHIYVLRKASKLMDYKLADFLEANKEEILSQSKDNNKFKVGVGKVEYDIHFESEKEIKEFATKSMSRIPQIK